MTDTTTGLRNEENLFTVEISDDPEFQVRLGALMQELQQLLEHWALRGSISAEPRMAA
jgi:hypothetical protein